ncbi:MAG: type IV pilus twitching motility protein PilT [Verrucomicrobiales bacterium]
MQGVTDQTPLGKRICEIADGPSISDFYVTPWEPLAYKFNGELIYDQFVYQPEENLPIEPGCEDYAFMIGPNRFRVNRMVTRGRYRWVMRLLPSSIPTVEEIEVPKAAIKAFLQAKNGLFLICGATGSGKTTTIASMNLHRAMRRREHMITFEDPIEYLYPTSGIPTLVSQREMGEDDMDFADALRGSLRQAPDVIMIGEIRDAETAEIAMQAAETGHVVVATLHTSSAAQTVQRFLKLIPEERVEAAQDTLADILRMVLCQRLLKDEVQNRRFATHEMLLQYDSICNLIRRGEFKKLDQELETGQKRGMISFEASLQHRREQGYSPAVRKETGFSSSEVSEFLEFEREEI